jgi:hypothetical protein
MACRENLQLLRQRYYYATWKADGTRYMMLITVDGCYLIDRNFNFRRVQMRFPCRNTTDVCMHISLLLECSLCLVLNNISLLFINETQSDITPPPPPSLSSLSLFFWLLRVYRTRLITIHYLMGRW